MSLVYCEARSPASEVAPMSPHLFADLQKLAWADGLLLIQGQNGRYDVRVRVGNLPGEILRAALTASEVEELVRSRELARPAP